MLISFLKDIFSAHPKLSEMPPKNPFIKSVLNVGGGSKSTPIPHHYDGWQHDLLDIDPRGGPDLVCDARELKTLPGGGYDAVYCSHNLEHYYLHEGLNVVRGFHHMLNETGFAEIRVPDLAQVIKVLTERRLDLDAVLYQSPSGPITAHDIIYGFQSEIQSTGQHFYAHKTGFTPNSLGKTLTDGGFAEVFLSTAASLSVHALAFKVKPTAEQRAALQHGWNFNAN
jgi:predicted SAM-dependent methyltransferase